MDSVLRSKEYLLPVADEGCVRVRSYDPIGARLLLRRVADDHKVDAEAEFTTDYLFVGVVSLCVEVEICNMVIRLPEISELEELRGYIIPEAATTRFFIIDGCRSMKWVQAEGLYRAVGKWSWDDVSPLMESGQHLRLDVSVDKLD